VTQQRGKVSVVGAGAVGTAISYACLLRGTAGHIALLDIDEAKVRAEVLDLNHGTQFVPACTVEGSADVAVTAGSDVVVVTAGAKQRPGQSRLDLAGANVAMARTVVPRLLEHSPQAVVVLVTNPVDVVTYAAIKVCGLSDGRVFGSGTVLDSSRLRFLLARHAGVAVGNVHAYVVGEHGDSELPLWSSATIGGVPLAAYPVDGRPLDAATRNAIAREVTDAAYEIIKGKGATSLAIGLATARIAEAVLRDERRVLPVSSLLRRWRGVDDVCLSLPSVVGRRGVERVLPTSLDAVELEGLRRSAEAVRSVARAVGV
jgi:L-lactate dehydrogenase